MSIAEVGGSNAGGNALKTKGYIDASNCSLYKKTPL
jgi:hypothetical protein